MLNEFRLDPAARRDVNDAGPQVTAERQTHVKLGEISRGGNAMRADNAASAPAIIAAIDDAIDTANHRFINTCAKDEVETYVDQLLSTKSADAKTRFGLDLESLSELLARHDPN